MKPARNLWKTDEIAVVREMAARGLPDRVIGERLGRSPDSVKHQRKAHGIASQVPPQGFRPVPDQFNPQASIRELAKEHRCDFGTATRWRHEVRSKTIVALPSIRVAKTFCSQCDRMVEPREAAGCRSRWCKAQ